MNEVNKLSDAYSWNITRIADAFGIDRGTARRRIKEAGIVPSGLKNGVSVYALKDVGPALFGDVVSSAGVDPDDMMPTDRKAYYQSENERIKFEEKVRNLIPIDEVHREMSQLAKAIASSLDSLPDMLERDAGLSAEAIDRVEEITDRLREQMFMAIVVDEEEAVANG